MAMSLGIGKIIAYLRRSLLLNYMVVGWICFTSLFFIIILYKGSRTLQPEMEYQEKLRQQYLRLKEKIQAQRLW